MAKGEKQEEAKQKSDEKDCAIDVADLVEMELLEATKVSVIA